MNESREVDAIRERYARRAARAAEPVSSMLHPATWQTVQERQRAIIDVLAQRADLRTVEALRLVEVGCGTGGNLLEFLRLGFQPENLQGIELIPERARAARRTLPAALEVLEGDASTAAIPEGTLDIVFQAVVFTSILDDSFQQKLAAAMWRWVRPGGGVLWYDFTFDNPRNRDVRGVPVRRIRELFPAGQLAVRRVTLAPPIARRAAAMHPALYRILNVLPFLRTHVLCWIQKP